MQALASTRADIRCRSIAACGRRIRRLDGDVFICGRALLGKTHPIDLKNYALLFPRERGYDKGRIDGI